MLNEKTSPKRFPRLRVVRTVLYDDVYVSDWELQLWHTPTMQRMYDLKQLGFADRIFPDAIHSRFNHSIGAVEMTERIIQSIRANLLEEINRMQATAEDLGETIPVPIRTNIEAGSTLLQDLEAGADMLRIATLIHDVTHIPYGHTLEDEIHAFPTRHDDPARQIRFFNQLFYEFIEGLFESLNPAALSSSLEKPDSEEDRFSLTQARYQELIRIESTERLIILQGFRRFCEVLRDAQVLLLHLHKPDGKKPVERLFSARILGTAHFIIEQDHYKLDIIGNTICADLLDYSRRDSFFSGLKLNFDNRIFRYFEVRRVDGIYRLAIRIFSNKIRLDVLSEILTILKMRYLLSERLIFHPTKCAAGAMLGRVTSLLGIKDVEDDFYEMGDREFLRNLHRRALFLIDLTIALLKVLKSDTVDPAMARRVTSGVGAWECEQILKLLVQCQLIAKETTPDLFGRAAEALQEIARVLSGSSRVSLNEEARKAAIKMLEDRRADAVGAGRLCKGILSRRFVKPVYQITRQAADEREVYGEDITERFKSAEEREKEERYVENALHFPRGSIIFYCPRKRTTLKEADVLVIWSKYHVQKFRDIDNPGFSTFVGESNSIEGKYKAIWNMYVFVEEALLPFAPLVQKILHDRLRTENSQLLLTYLDEDPRVRRLSKDMRGAEDVVSEAMARTWTASRDAGSGGAARFAQFPDFMTLFMASLDEVLREKRKDSNSPRPQP